MSLHLLNHFLLSISFPSISEVVSDIYHIHRNDIPTLNNFQKMILPDLLLFFNRKAGVFINRKKMNLLLK